VVAIQTWKEAGDKVLLMTNFNNDIHDPAMIQFFWALGLHAIHLLAYGWQDPPTHQWGSKP